MASVVIVKSSSRDLIEISFFTCTCTSKNVLFSFNCCFLAVHLNPVASLFFLEALSRVSAAERLLEASYDATAYSIFNTEHFQSLTRQAT